MVRLYGSKPPWLTALNVSSPAARDPRAAVAAMRQARHQRTVVRLIGAVYWLLIFEGVLRKWLLPQWGRPLFFVRDPLVISIYLLVLARGTSVPRSPLLYAGLGFGFIGLGLIAIHAAFDQAPLGFIPIYGWRNYFLYLPLAFVIARYFELSDVELLARRTLQACIPMAVLVLFQSAAPAYSAINAGLGAGADQIYTIQTTVSGVVRPAGTFTSDLGLTAFITSALAIATAMWIMPVRFRPLGTGWLMAATLSILACLSVSGSRGVLLWSGVVIFGAMATLLFAAPAMHLKVTILIVLLVGAGAVVTPILFPRTTQAFIQRWADAGASESKAYGSGGVFARALHEMFLFRVLLPVTPPAGYGLGSAGNAAWRLGIRGDLIDFNNQEEINAAESDWGRHILELGPIFGCCLIAFRVAFVWSLARQAFAATRRSGHPLPLLLCIYVSSLLLQGQITGNGTLNGFAWMFVGLCMAASYHVRKRNGVPVRSLQRQS